jgi:hypothetical protein
VNWNAFIGSLAEAPAGGTNWTQNVDDTIALTEATALGTGLGLSESLTLSEALAFGRGLVLAESLSLSEALALGRGLTLSEALTLADAVAAGLAFAQQVDETLTLSDLVSPATGKGATIADTLTLADALAFERGLSLSEALTLGEALSFARQIGLVEALTLGDSVLPELTPGAVNWTRTVDDLLALADSLSIEWSGAGALPAFYSRNRPALSSEAAEGLSSTRRGAVTTTVHGRMGRA